MSLNVGVEEYLDYYLSPRLGTDFAVMLIGPWGAGKTYFIKEYLERREKGILCADRPRSAKHLYASLYGVRSVSEITDQFFAQAHPILNSNVARLLGTALSHGVNGYLGTEVNSAAESGSIIRDMVLNLKDRVLIFDDLERCSMPLADIMGFINAYVEHDGIKVILIANEDDIPTDQREEYRRKKEKLVGKTLQVMSEPEVVLRSFVDKLTAPDVKEAINRDSGPLLRTFAASEKHNFRSLRSVLLDFERLVTASDRRLRESPQAMANLLLFMMATGIEYRGGDLTGTVLAELPRTLMAAAFLGGAQKEKTPEMLQAERLETTYADVMWRDPIVPPAVLAQLFETGVVDTSLINEHVAKHPLVVGYAGTPAWRRLWNWAGLPRAEYLEARKQLIAELQEHQLTHPGVILHAAGIALGLRDFGDRLLGNEDIPSFFERYVEDVRAAGTLEPARDLFGDHGRSYAGLGYASEESLDFRKIHAAVRAATSLSFAQYMRGVASTFLDRIANSPAACSSLHEYGVEKGNYADAPFLHYIDPDDFARAIINDSSPNSRLLASLCARYEFERHNRALADEYPWLKRLRSRLEAIAAASDPPYKRLLEIRIKYSFDKIDTAVSDAEGSDAGPA